MQELPRLEFSPIWFDFLPFENLSCNDKTIPLVEKKNTSRRDVEKKSRRDVESWLIRTREEEMLRFDRIKALFPFVFRSNKVPRGEQKLIRLKEVGTDGSKRRPMRAEVVHPWYSPFRRRNMIILGCGLVCFLFSKLISDFFKSIVRGKRLEAERQKFLKQLDEEDRIYEMKLAARKALKSKED